MTLDRRLLSLADQGDWNDALGGVEHAFWHRWDAAAALHAGNGHPVFLLRCEDGQTGAAAVCVFAERQFDSARDIYGPGGFAGFTGAELPGLRESWLEFVTERDYVCGYFPLHPVLALRAAFEPVDQHNPLYVLDIREGSEGMLRSAGTNVRRTVQSWRRRDDAACVQDRSRLSEFVTRHFDAFLKRRGASPAARWSTPTIESMCHSEDVLLVGAEDREGLCIVAGFGLGSQGGEYLFNVNLREGRRLTAVMIAWAADQLCERGLEWLNLGGGLKKDDELARAKQRYHPRSLPFMTARETYDARQFRLSCLHAGKDPEAAGGFFPPFHEQRTDH